MTETTYTRSSDYCNFGYRWPTIYCKISTVQSPTQAHELSDTSWIYMSDYLGKYCFFHFRILTLHTLIWKNIRSIIHPSFFFHLVHTVSAIRKHNDLLYSKIYILVLMGLIQAYYQYNLEIMKIILKFLNCKN